MQTIARNVSPVASAQIKSALLLAGLFGGTGVSITEPHRSRDHTERLFRYLGVRVRVSGTAVSVPAFSFRPDGFETTIPGDPSSAAFFLAMALWRLEQEENARGEYEKATAWMEKNAPKNEELLRFREEARKLLQIDG